VKFILPQLFFLSALTGAMGQTTLYSDTAYAVSATQPGTTSSILPTTESTIRIQNSFPKGGQRYRGPDGRDFVYAIFWTRVVNETPLPVELTLHFPADSFFVPSSPGTYFKILMPPDTMTPDKEPLYDYGMKDLRAFLDAGLNRPTGLKQTLRSKKERLFYVVVLVNQGVEGAIRTGLVLEKQDLFYTILRPVSASIPCGEAVFK